MRRGGRRSWLFGRGLLGAIVCGVLLAGLFLAASARAEGACPNEAVRLEQGVSGLLPDCRAYEMVSPAYQEGFPLSAAGYSADGNDLIIEGLSDIAGAPGLGEGGLEAAVYLEARGVRGWQVASLNAPLSEFIGQLPIAREAASGLSLWMQHTPGQSAKTRDLYIRLASGVYSEVGPLDPHDTSSEEPSDAMEVQANELDSPEAATSDYGHIVLGAVEAPAYWPFDNTKGPNSLYEYSGTDNEHPVLVAVNGPEKGNADLIAECGAVLGSAGERGSRYNALSADGETVFFTVERCGTAPETAEVYARLHGSHASPLSAETFDVSGSECTSACGGVSGKNFEGASEDGKRVYFTSTQKLTNDAIDGTATGNAAVEGESCEVAVTAGGGGGGCNLYEYEFMPEHKHILRLVAGGDEVLGVAGVAEDGEHVYFVAREEIANAGENEYHARPVREQPNLYVYDANTQTTKFIATLSGGDERDWVRFFLKRTDEVSGDTGQFLLFVSAKESPGITPDTAGGLPQLFEYDADTGELVRVTKGENGYNNNGNNAAPGISVESIVGFANGQQEGGQGFRASSDKLNVSANGGTVAFETAGELSPLVVSAQKGCTSIYEFRTDGLLSQGDVHLISDGRDVQANKGSQCGAQFEGIDASGDNILFSTADPLVSGDADGVIRSLYDARIDGGFGSSLGEGSCGGGGCEGSASTAPPASAAPGSASLTGAGNLAQPPVAPTKVVAKKTVKPVKCAKGKTRRHGRCVKAKRKVKDKAKGTSVALRMRGARFHG